MKVKEMRLPFSRRGSYLVISPIHKRGHDSNALYIRMIRGGDEKTGAVFKINLLDESDKHQNYEVEMTPHLMRISAKAGILEVCFSSERTIRMRGYGVRLELTAFTGFYDYALECPDGTLEINSFTEKRRFRLIPIEGKIEVDAPFEEEKSKFIRILCSPDHLNKAYEVALTDYKINYEKDLSIETSFHSSVQSAAEDFEIWKEKTLKVPEHYENAREAAAYITWSSIVNAEGLLTRPAMYMSKNWMTNIWSWDHCFNAMALIKNQPQLAWDQYCLFFDLQDESGALPDFSNDQYSLWNCCKPPIHGWTLKWMMDRSDWISEDRLAEVYQPLAKWTDWWFRYRDHDQDGIPQYNHGNDSGWDNSTVFCEGKPVETPDLSAFLIIQMDVLESIANKLGKNEDAFRWKKKANEMFTKMMEHFWTDGGFRACLSNSHKQVMSESLILFIPFILGNRLTDAQKTILLDSLITKHQFETEHGFATECINSPFYRPDGYWRGPIWAPSTMLLTEGLKAIGEYELSRKTAIKFCEMAAQSGMAENFNALTGAGLRDPAFTWTSSVFLILANELDDGTVGS
ncbi:amylo-alpha-1,6-glucosidase [Cytobacillus firmus]|uniref:amylo-alpha-1,6-glucosidase n=1 Tax=Cytobacillus firmus TaxID=1399 RepID=UPI001C8E03B2|nr:trehalase family glycosidase [Cytobacillus firmus]MBX9976268.1 hypothetical protein [Cytobacillus firmus]